MFLETRGQRGGPTLYLRRVIAENFRVFGDKATGKNLDLELGPGLNVLVGENDSGKTAIVDAIRFSLLTTSYEFIQVQEDDFHVDGGTRADSLSIEVEFRDLTQEQQAAILDWLTYKPGEDPYLVVQLSAQRRPNSNSRRGRLAVSVRSGHDGIGPEIGSAVREMIRATYLRPMRDAEAELRPGRQSRLSQVLMAHKGIAGQETSDFDPGDLTKQPTTLVGHMDQAQYHIAKSTVIETVQSSINDKYLRDVAFEGDSLSSRIRVAAELSLQRILERLELTLTPPRGIDADQYCTRGLGYNNVLFMSTELVLLGEGEDLALLLIEEPEAHLHPQLQTRMLNLFQAHAARQDRPVQVIVTTHSPNLASSAPVECIIIVVRGRAFRLAKGETMLEDGDYEFLRRFLDSTKANLFFARGVAIVEGAAEALVMPALAEACGRSFATASVSIVNVGSVGLFRYARVLQRKDESELPIPVACITDRDIVPNHITYIQRGKKRRRFVDEFTVEEVADLLSRKKARAERGSTKVFVSDHWTLEYDLAISGLGQLMHDAVALAIAAEKNDGYLSDQEEADILRVAGESWAEFDKNGASIEDRAAAIYEPLSDKTCSKAVAAQYIAKLLRTGSYGQGVSLFNALPEYLKGALIHLTGPMPHKGGQ